MATFFRHALLKIGRTTPFVLLHTYSGGSHPRIFCLERSKSHRQSHCFLICDKIMRPSSILFLVILPSLATAAESMQNQDAPIPSGPTTNQDRVVDYEYCYEAMGRHDGDLNKRITKNEFLGFCQDFGGNTECLANLVELPIELQSVWNEITCECAQRGGAEDCCIGSNAHIPTNGVLPSDTTTISQQQFLRQACLRTDQAIIAYCGPPPVPRVIGPPGGTVLPSPEASSLTSQDIIMFSAIAAALLILLCCCRRRWFFCPDRKQEVDSDEERDEDPEQHDPNGTIPHESGGMVHANAERRQARVTASETDNQMGATKHERMIEDPDYEDEENQKKFVYEQYDLPEQPMDSIRLRPVTRPPPPELEEEPYKLEHYTPDGGIIRYEKTGNFAYNADGGVAPQVRSVKEKVDPYRPKYTRKEKDVQEEIDNSRQRFLSGYDGSGIFLELDKIPDDHDSRFAGMPDWVVLKSLNSLNENVHQLDESSSDDWDVIIKA